MIRVDNWLSPVQAGAVVPVVPESANCVTRILFLWRYLFSFLFNIPYGYAIRNKENINNFSPLCMLVDVWQHSVDLLQYFEFWWGGSVSTSGIEGEVSQLNIYIASLHWIHKLLVTEYGIMDPKSFKAEGQTEVLLVLHVLVLLKLLKRVYEERRKWVNLQSNFLGSQLELPSQISIVNVPRPQFIVYVIHTDGNAMQCRFVTKQASIYSLISAVWKHEEMLLVTRGKASDLGQ